MRIISKFNDYYDSALAYGMDPGLVYRRETSESTAPEEWHGTVSEILADRPLDFWDDEVIFSFVPVLVGVGVRGFRVWVPYQLKLTADLLGVNTSNRVDADRDEIRNSFIVEGERNFGFSPRRSAPDVDAFMKKVSEPVELPSAWCIALGAPCYLIECPFHSRKHGCRTILNPRLATLGLDKRLDPFSAFQEITMCLGHWLAAEDNAPRTVGDDRVIAASKGFDEQSFRTAAPGKKKENRRANRARKRQRDL